MNSFLSITDKQGGRISLDSSEEREWKEKLEKELEEWFNAVSGEGQKGKALKQEAAAYASAKRKMAGLFVLSEFLARAISRISKEETDEGLKAIADKSIELTSTLADILKDYISSASKSGSDEMPDREPAYVEDEMVIEPNAAEEWLASGVADMKTPSESRPPEPPVAQPIPSDMPPESPKPAGPVISPEEQLKAHLHDLQKAVSWGKAEEAEKARKRIFAMSSQFPKGTLDKKIHEYEKRGRDFKRVKMEFESLIQTKGILGKTTGAFWKGLPNSKTSWFVFTAGKMIESVLSYELRNLLRTNPPESSTVADFIRKATSVYGNLASQLPQLRDAHQTWIPVVDPGLDHRIQSLQPSSGWTLYIDETGLRFGDQEGKEGRVVGLVFPEKTALAQLPKGFHASSAAPAEVLHRLNELLSTPCGILGLGIDDLHQMTQEHWLASVLEVVTWVWRLLPLPKEEAPTPVTLDVLIENKGTYDATKDLEWLQTALAIAWDKESPHRNKMIQLGKLDFVPKDTGLIGWVDSVAYCWGASKEEIKEGLHQSRLTGSCLLKGIRELLPVWAKAINGNIVEANEWQRLTEQKDAEQRGSLTHMALDALTKTCRQSPGNWQRYVDAMDAYLATKKYDLTVVERQANWLAAMEGIEMSPEMRFFWKMAELAKHNHTGEVTTQAMRSTKAEVTELSQKAGQIVPHARCHAMLRLAVADANAFDFKAAGERFAAWNPDAGGTLMGSALWDGKILSSLGQYLAFQGYPEKALPYFDRALAQFKVLESVDPIEASRQHSQTATYAAIAAMDVQELSTEERNARMEQALGTSVLEAARKMGGDASPGNRYLHHLLARYLVSHGSEGQRAAYRRTSSNWLIPEIGMGAGHPWPLIQYYRWELTKDRKLIESIFDYCWGREQGATVKLIGMAIGIASGMLSPDSGLVSDVLQDLKTAMPKAEEQIDKLLSPNGLSGLDLLKRVLTFNYR